MTIKTEGKTREQILGALVRQALAIKHPKINPELIAKEINAAIEEKITDAEKHNYFYFDALIIDDQQIFLFVDLTNKVEFDTTVYDAFYGANSASSAFKSPSTPAFIKLPVLPSSARSTSVGNVPSSQQHTMYIKLKNSAQKLSEIANVRDASSSSVSLQGSPSPNSLETNNNVYRLKNNQG